VWQMGRWVCRGGGAWRGARRQAVVSPARPNALWPCLPCCGRAAHPRTQAAPCIAQRAPCHRAVCGLVGNALQAADAPPEHAPQPQQQPPAQPPPAAQPAAWQAAPLDPAAAQGPGQQAAPAPGGFNMQQQAGGSGQALMLPGGQAMQLVDAYTQQPLSSQTAALLGAQPMQLSEEQQSQLAALLLPQWPQLMAQPAEGPSGGVWQPAPDLQPGAVPAYL